MGKDQDLLHAVRNQDKEVLQRMLNKNKSSPKGKLMGTTKRINVNVQDSDGMTGLHQAALLGDTEMMKILIDSGAMVDVKDLKGMRPLHYAAWQGKEISTVSLLLKEGSSANEPSHNGTTPLHLACEHGHFNVVSQLLQHHGDPTIEDNDHKTPLDLACEFGRYQVVELLVRSTLCNHLITGTISDDVSNRHFTCLHLAARNGHTDVMRLLLQAGVDVNRQTLNGTCLHEAALYGKTEAVRILLEAGVDVNQTNSYEQTALDIVNTFTTTKAGKELKHLLKGSDRDGAISPQPSYSKLPMSQSSLAVRHSSVNSSAADRTDEWVGRCMDSYHQPAISTSQHSPANSNRNSTGSTNSGCLVTQQHRLSGVSYESGHSYKSYCSNSSSSVGSLDRLEESGYSSAVNVHELFQSGLADSEILHTWLADLHFDEYYDLFIQAGYDMPTIAHMTPQDLSAIGISNPKHRKQLKQEINKLYIQDGFPDYKPADIGEWLHLLGLQEYYQCLQQECATIDDVLDIECEDLEEIGITKLGHQKKIQVAIECLKRIQSNRKRLSSLDCKPAQDMLAPPSYHGARWLGVSSSGYRSNRCLQRSTSGDNLYASSGPLELTTFQQPKEEEDSRGSEPCRGEVMGKSWPSPSLRHGQRDQDVVPIQLPRAAMMHTMNTCTRVANDPPPPYTFYDTHDHNAVNTGMVSPRERHVVPEDGEETATIRRPSAKISPRIAPKPKPVAKIMAKTKQDNLADGTAQDSSNNMMEKSCGSLAYSCSTLPRKLPKHSTTEHVIQAQSPVFGSFGINYDSKQSTVDGHGQDGCNKVSGKKVPPPPPPKRTNSMKCNMNKIGQVLEPQSSEKPVSSLVAPGIQQTNILPQSMVKPSSYVNSSQVKAGRSFEKQEVDNVTKSGSTGVAVTETPISDGPGAYGVMTSDYMPSGMDGPLNSIIQQLEQQAATAGVASQKVAPPTSTSQDKDGDPDGWSLEDDVQHTDQADLDHGQSAGATLSDSASSSGSIDMNTLPFANENVGTIKQRNPNNKTSIVTVGGGEEGDLGGSGTDNVDLNFEVFNNDMNTIQHRGHSNNQKQAGQFLNEGQHKVAASISQKEIPNSTMSTEDVHSGDVLTDIDNMLQDLTDELDAMLDLEVT